MARIARFVAPGLPHHVTQRGNRRETVFFSDADYELYRDLLGQQCRKHGVAVWSYCGRTNALHSPRDAQPRSSHSRPHRARRAGAGARRGASTLQRGRQRAIAGDRASLPVAFRLGGDGRGASDDGGALCRAQSGARAPRRQDRGLALVERARPSRGARRRAGRGRAADRALRRALRRPDRRAAAAASAGRAARRRDDRPPARRPRLPRPPRPPHRPRPAPAQARAEGGRMGIE